MSDSDQEEWDKHPIKFDNEEEEEFSKDVEEEAKELRLKLVEEQMRNQHTKHEHRKSLVKLEFMEEELKQLRNQYNEKNNDNKNDNENEILKKKIKELENKLNSAKNKNVELDKERRNSLSQLSKNMFNKVLNANKEKVEAIENAETQAKVFNSKIQNLTEQIINLQETVTNLEKSKENLIIITSQTINELRDTVKHLSTRLQKYEKW